MSKLLLLGGGHAHVQVLRAMASQDFGAVQTTLVSPHARPIYSGMVPGLVAGQYTVEDCAMALGPLAQAAGVTRLEASVVSLDADARRVTLSNGKVLDYDWLSVDTGAWMDRDSLPGAREHGLFLSPVEHFVGLLGPLLELATVRARHIVVVGGGAAGVEIAMACAMRLRSVGDGLSRVALVTGGGLPLGGDPRSAVRRAQAALRERGVTVLLESCVGVEAQHVILGNGARLACDAPILCLEASPAPWLAGSGLALDERGFIATGPTLQSHSHADVFAVAGAASHSDITRPRTGVDAVSAGPTLARNLQAALAGTALTRHRTPLWSLKLLSCGDGQAIASWGPFAARGAWAGRWKDRSDRACVARCAVPSTPSPRS